MSQIKVLITDGMAAPGVDILKKSGKFSVDLRKSTDPSELAGMIGGYDCIVIRSATTLTPELIEKATSMKLIVRAGAGVDNIDVPTATAKKIPVMNTASANSLAAAEHTIALLFAVFRQIPSAAQSLSEGRWDRALFKGFEVTGKTMGVVGLGNIGRIVAEKAVGLGMSVIAYDPFIKTLSQVPGRLSQMEESVTVVTQLEEVLKRSDVVTLHIPKTAETKNLINASRLAMMKDGAFLLNCARGGVVDEKAVVEAVDSGKLNGAAFDVFEKEPIQFPNALVNHPKIVTTPHLGASTFEAQERVALTAANQICGFFEKGDRAGIING